MATRQYIGARYVPKFYQNSVDGSTQWESNVVYEPLTYVTLINGHMYISKKQVPATIGSPATNIEYWLDVGTYDGYIDDLQQQINAITGTTIPALEGSISSLDARDDVLEDIVKVLPLVYSLTESYTPYDYVIYNGKVYQAIENSTGVLPTNTSYWKELGDIEYQFEDMEAAIDTKAGLSLFTPTIFDVNVIDYSYYGSCNITVRQVGMLLLVHLAISNTLGHVLPANTTLTRIALPTSASATGFYIFSTTGNYRMLVDNNGMISNLTELPYSMSFEGDIVLPAAGWI